MKHLMKIRPAWRNKKGEQAGAIISLPISLLNEIGAEVGESLSISAENDMIVLRKIKVA